MPESNKQTKLLNDKFRRSAEVRDYRFSTSFQRFDPSIYEQVINALRDTDSVRFTDLKNHSSGFVLGGKIEWQIADSGGSRVIRVRIKTHTSNRIKIRSPQAA